MAFSAKMPNIFEKLQNVKPKNQTIMETSPIEKLTQLFGLALANRLCKNKSDFAELIGMDNSSISHAFANNGKIKVENVVRRAEEALNKAGVQSLFGSNARHET